MSYLVEFHLGPQAGNPEWDHFATRVDLVPPPVGAICRVVTDKPFRGLEAGAVVDGQVERLEYCEAEQVMIYRVMLSPRT